MTAPEDIGPDVDLQMKELLHHDDAPAHGAEFWAKLDAEFDDSVVTGRTLGTPAPMAWRSGDGEGEDRSTQRVWLLAAGSVAAALLLLVGGLTLWGDGFTPDATVVLSESGPLEAPTADPGGVAPKTQDLNAPEAPAEAAPVVVAAAEERPEVASDPTAVTPEPPTPNPVPTATAAAQTVPADIVAGTRNCTFAVGTEDHLNVRSSPTLGAPVLDEIPGGSCAVWILDRSEDGKWANVRYGLNGIDEGWVSAEFLTEIVDLSSAIIDINGVAGVAWGTQWPEVEQSLVAQLGLPDEVISDWKALCGDPTGESERVLRWSNLEVRFSDLTSAQLVAARLTGSGVYSAVGGLTAGMSFEELAEFFPGAATLIWEPGQQWMWRSEAAYREYRPTFSGFFEDGDKRPTAESVFTGVSIGQWVQDC